MRIVEALELRAIDLIVVRGKLLPGGLRRGSTKYGASQQQSR